MGLWDEAESIERSLLQLYSDTKGLQHPEAMETVEMHLNALTRALASRSLHIYVAHCSVDRINKFAPQQKPY